MLNKVVQVHVLTSDAAFLIFYFYKNIKWFDFVLEELSPNEVMISRPVTNTLMIFLLYLCPLCF